MPRCLQRFCSAATRFQGVNDYLPVPTYDPERHMAFQN